MGIAEERRLVEMRYRSSRNRMLIRVFAYVTSLIPAILIALNFEAFRQYVIVAFGGHVEPVVQQPSDPVQQPKPQRTLPQPRPKEAVRQTPIVPVRQAIIEVQPVPVVRRQPVRLLEPSKKPDFEITLDLSKSRQGYPVESAKLRVLPIDRATMSPNNGILDAQNPVTLTLAGKFNPRIVLSLDDDRIWIKYEVESATGRLIPFTTTNLNAIRRKVVRNGKQAVAVVAGLEAEKAKLDAYLAASGGKLWTEKKAAELRVQELPGLIATARKRVSALETDLRVADGLIALAESVDGTTIGFAAG